MSKPKVLILLDADVVIHLFKCDKISLLTELYKGRLRMLDIVFSELCGNSTIRDHVENLFTFKLVELIQFPTTSNPSLLKEYLQLANSIGGKGERSSLLYCKHYHHVIASSNTKDIRPFCEAHSIAYLTTLDLLTIAMRKELLTKEVANECINKIITKGSYLLSNTIEDYSKYFDEAKMGY